MGNVKALVLDGARFRVTEQTDTICDGTMTPVGGGAGTLQVQAATEVANSGITIKAYSGGSLLAR